MVSGRREETKMDEVKMNLQGKEAEIEQKEMWYDTECHVFSLVQH